MNIQLLNDFYIIDDIIVNRLNPSNFSGADSSETLLELVEVAKISAKLNKKNLITQTFEIKNGNTAEQVIHNYQERFIFLSNFLNESFKKSNTFSKHLHTLDSLVDDLLQFIQTYFPKRFDNNFEVLTKTKLSKIAEYKKLIAEKIYKQNPVKTELLEIALHPFELLFNESSTPFTFHNSIYLDKHIAIIHETIKQSGNKEFDEVLTKKLIQNNFNSWQFAFYLIQKIKDSIDYCINPIDQINLFNWHAKTYQQTYINSDLPFKLNSKSITEQLIEWIQCELKYFPKEGSQTTMSENNRIKLNFNMSAPSTTAFLNLLKKIEVLNHVNPTELSRAISQNCRTKYMSSLSENTIYNHCFRTPQSTNDEIKDVIIKMLNEANK